MTAPFGAAVWLHIFVLSALQEVRKMILVIWLSYQDKSSRDTNINKYEKYQSEREIDIAKY